MSEQQPGNPERNPLALQPRVWIASLADYNAGRLHGEWVDAAVEGDELVAEAKRIIAASPDPSAEEWAIFDYDNFFSYRVNEYQDLHRVAEIARGIAEDGEAFAAYAQLSGLHGDELDRGYTEAFVGYWQSRDAFLDELLEDFGIDDALAMGMPGWLLPHIKFDREGLLRDLLVDFEVHDVSDGGIYLFRL
jgi:antirestriction protein